MYVECDCSECKFYFEGDCQLIEVKIDKYGVCVKCEKNIERPKL